MPRAVRAHGAALSVLLRAAVPCWPPAAQTAPGALPCPCGGALGCLAVLRVLWGWAWSRVLQGSPACCMARAAGWASCRSQGSSWVLALQLWCPPLGQLAWRGCGNNIPNNFTVGCSFFKFYFILVWFGFFFFNLCRLPTNPKEFGSI